MSNEILWFLFAIINFIMVVISYKLFGKMGLFAWIACGTILANIQVTKAVILFGFDATLGNVMYGTLFLVTDALGEKYSHKEAKKAVYIGFYTLITSIIIMQFALLFIPTSYDWADDHLKAIFDFLPRIAVASLIAYIISQTLDVYLFKKIKERNSSDLFLIIRNNGSTIISQFIDTLIFVPLAFINLPGIGLDGLPFDVVKNIFITTYLIKVIVALLDTPFVYIIKYINPIKWKNAD